MKSYVLLIFLFLFSIVGCKESGSNHYSQEARARMQSIGYSIIHLCHQHPEEEFYSYSAFLKSYEAFLPGGLDSFLLQDPWGNYYRLFVEKTSANERNFIICSSGPNKLWNDEDDIHHYFSIIIDSIQKDNQ